MMNVLESGMFDPLLCGIYQDTHMMIYTRQDILGITYENCFQ
jgi:hypothetical protein